MPVTESTRQRLMTTLFVGQSLFSAAYIAMVTLMVIIAADIGGSDALAGIPNTLALLAQAAAAFPIGVLLDKVGRRLGLSSTFGITTLGCAIAIWAITVNSFLLFCAGSAVIGAGRAGTEQSRYIAAEINVAARRAKVVGFIVFAGTIGAIFGPQLVVPAQNLAVTIGLPENTGPYLIGILFYLAALGITMIFLRPDPRDIGEAIQASERKTVEAIPAQPYRLIFRRPGVIMAVAAMTISQLVMTLVMAVTPLHMDHLNHETRSIGIVISAHTFGMFGLSGVTGWLIDRYGRIPLIIAGAMVLVVASIWSSQAVSVLALAGALFLLGLGWNFCFVAGSSLLSDSLIASERSRTQGLSNMILAGAAATASFSTAILFAQAGIAAVAAVALAFSLVIFGFVLYYGASKRPVQQPELG